MQEREVKISNMNQRYIDYANYNIWANNRLISDLQQQDETLMTQSLAGSFPTIYATLLHIWFAEVGWLARMTGKGWETSKVDNFKGTANELFLAWQATSEEFRNFVQSADLEQGTAFSHKGVDYSIPAREVIQTVFNHGSYHRGQVVMMMRQLGVSTILQTDYIEWVRQNANSEL